MQTDSRTADAPPGSAPPGGSDDLRLIMVKAPDDHVIQKYDSIDEPCWTPRGTVFAPSLACNVPDAVGKLAREYNAVGRQVWTGKMLPVRGGKLIRQNDQAQAQPPERDVER